MSFLLMLPEIRVNESFGMPNRYSVVSGFVTAEVSAIPEAGSIVFPDGPLHERTARIIRDKEISLRSGFVWISLFNDNVNYLFGHNNNICRC